MGSRRERLEKKKRIQRRRILCVVFIGILIVLLGILFNSIINRDNKEKINTTEDKSSSIETEEPTSIDNREENNEQEKIEFILSAAGDFTLGTDTKFSYSGSFPEAAQLYGYDYGAFMKNVYDIFSNDDYTFVNLETTFTDSEVKAYKSGDVFYNFKGDKAYVNILKEGSIEGVTVDNNHIYDYGEQGFKDTIQVLSENSIDYCGNGYKVIKEVKGVKIGLLGYSAWYVTEELKNKIDSDIQELRDAGCVVVIPYFHWGQESKSYPDETQIEIGRYAVDCGADLVLGSHPHVIQTVEYYKDTIIAYSLGNFCFGGNSNPTDKDTFILQVHFSVIDNSITDRTYRIIPVTVSSVDYKNDYIPTIAEGERKNEIYSRIYNLSPTIQGIIVKN